MSLIRIVTYSLVYLIYLIISVIILLEVAFQFLPTTLPVDLKPISDKTDVLRFYPNKLGRFSLGANYYQVVEKRTNNYGFYSDYDFIANAEPEIAIIGDSFVQAAQIKNKDSFGEILQSEKANLKIYQLGISGAPLSQYIQMLKFAKKEFKPQHYFVVLVGNDFDESVCKYGIKKGTWCFNNEFELVFNPYLGTRGLKNVIRKSALLRYLVFQIGLDWRKILSSINGNEPLDLKSIFEMFWIDEKNRVMKNLKYAGNTERFKSEEITRMSKKAITSFFHEILKLNLVDKITLIIDADREDIYINRTSHSYFNQMRLFTMKEAISNGVNFIDMDPIFRNDFATFEKKFNFPTDEHWNEHAHKILSRILYNEYQEIRK